LPPLASSNDASKKPELSYGGLDGDGGGLAEAADGGVAHRLGHVVDEEDFVGDGAEGAAGYEAVEGFFLTDGADAAGDALATGLVAEKGGDAVDGVCHVGGLVEDNDHAGAEGGT